MSRLHHRSASLTWVLLVVFLSFYRNLTAADTNGTTLINRSPLLAPLNSRGQGVKTIKVTNNCPNIIHPATLTQKGDGGSVSGFALNPGESRSLVGDVPVTLAEFDLAGNGGTQTYYDLSLVDGYNLPMGITLLANGQANLAAIGPYLTNPTCIGSPNFLAAIDGYDPYASVKGSGSFPVNYERVVDVQQVARWCPWGLQLSPPTKPGDGVYPYPDDNIQRPDFDPCFSMCSKYNEPEYCCTGSYDDPNICKPSMYSNNAKQVCPDAYSFAFDDQTSTFVIPTGGSFEVVLCPSGRSTNIIATSKEQLEHLKKTGTVGRRDLGNGTTVGVDVTRKNAAVKGEGSTLALVVALGGALLLGGLL
ncbi:MAG: hypothetical protein M1829_005344 [Trizodia sp. TS-e1964]|nr:MAG: hypothetical protein M1829_005344 [Trizodia sp. TS-e1964]